MASQFLDTFESLTRYKHESDDHDLKNVVNSEETITVARFLAHGDEHTGNHGIIKNDNIIEAAIVDFSKSLNDFPSTILYSLSNFKTRKLNYTPKTMDMIQKIVNVGKEMWLSLIEQLFRDLNSVYDDAKTLKEKENEIKESILNRLKLCEKELLLDHNIIQHIYSITPWDMKVSFSPIEFNEYIDDMLIDFVSNNDTSSLLFLLPYIIHQPNFPELIKGAFDLTVQEKKEPFFDMMLPYIGQSPNLMESALIQSIKTGQVEFFNKMLPYMKCFPESMKNAAVTAFKLNKTEFFDQMFPYISQSPDAMQDAFENAVALNQVDLFDKMFSYIKTSPEAMQKAFDKAILVDNMGFFDNILPYIGRSPAIMANAFYRSITSKRTDFFDKIFPYIKTSPEAMEAAFNQAVELKMTTYFDKMLPYMVNTLELMQKAFTNSIELNDMGSFDKMLPCMGLSPQFMEDGFILSAYSSYKGTFFSKMLPYMEQSPKSLLRVLDKNMKLFTKFLPYLKHSPELMEFVFYKSILNDQMKYFDEILPYIHHSIPQMKHAFRIAIQDKKEEFFNKMFPYAINSLELMEEIFKLSIECEQLEIFDKVLPYVMHSPEFLKYTLSELYQEKNAEFHYKIALQKQQAPFKFIKHTVELHAAEPILKYGVEDNLLTSYIDDLSKSLTATTISTDYLY